MRKSMVFVAVAGFAAVGCLGSDPNQNSMLLHPDAGNMIGTGGSSGGGNVTGPITGTAVATFDTTVEGFALDNYEDSDKTYTNIDRPSWLALGHDRPMLTFTADDGSPSPGSINVVAPFTDKNQHVDLQSATFSTPQNWTGGTLHVRVKITSGSLPTGGAQLFVKTGTAYEYGGTYTNIQPGTGWKQYSLDLTNPMTLGTSGTFDASQIMSYGVQINTGSAAMNQTSVTFDVDSFSVDLPGGTHTDAGGAHTDGGGDGG
jgi:hypothetical protein